MRIKQLFRKYRKNPSYIVRDQYQLGPFIGAIKTTYTHVAVYFNLGTFLMMTATFWYTTGWKWSHQYLGFDLTYLGFMIALIAGLFLFSILVYKMEMPSTFRFYFDQMFMHSTLMPKRFDDIEDKLNSMSINTEFKPIMWDGKKWRALLVV